VARDVDHGREMCSDSVRAWWSGVQIRFPIKTIGPLDPSQAHPAAYDDPIQDASSTIFSRSPVSALGAVIMATCPVANSR
jgi:hypothetical protein